MKKSNRIDWADVTTLALLLRDDPSGERAYRKWERIIAKARYSSFMADELWRWAEAYAYRPFETKDKFALN